MKRMCAVVVVVLLVLLVATASVSAVKPVKPQENYTKTLSVHYKYTAELGYEEIWIKDGVLNYKHLAHSVEPQGAVAMQQRPYWTEKDLKTEKVKLSDKELAGIVKLIKDSGFMRTRFKLNSKYRYYPHTISAKLGKQQNTVTYAVARDLGPEPKAFTQVKEKLFAMVKSKFGMEAH